MIETTPQPGTSEVGPIQARTIILILNMLDNKVILLITVQFIYKRKRIKIKKNR
jgi:hypothetical protein